MLRCAARTFAGVSGIERPRRDRGGCSIGPATGRIMRSGIVPQALPAARSASNVLQSASKRASRVVTLCSYSGPLMPPRVCAVYPAGSPCANTTGTI
jgi:hypothetical protein